MQVLLSDGDLATLANMKLNLEMNHLNTGTDLPETSIENRDVVSSILGDFTPSDIPCANIRLLSFFLFDFITIFLELYP